MEAVEFRLIRCPVCREVVFEASPCTVGEIRIKCRECSRALKRPLLVTIEIAFAFIPVIQVESPPLEKQATPEP